MFHPGTFAPSTRQQLDAGPLIFLLHRATEFPTPPCFADTGVRGYSMPSRDNSLARATLFVSIIVIWGTAPDLLIKTPRMNGGTSQFTSPVKVRLLLSHDPNKGKSGRTDLEGK